MAVRQALARRTPSPIRKAIRMGEHYVRRIRSWFEIHRELKGVSKKDRQIVARSFLASPVTSLRRLDGYQSPVLFADADVEINGVGRFTVRAATDDIIHVMTAREPIERREIERLLQPGDTFVDAGANIGFYSVVAHRRVGPTGRIVAFEMMPPTAARLRDHLAVNGIKNAEVIERALSDQSGHTIVARSDPEKLGQASIVTEASDAKRTLRFKVRTVTLDEALAHVGPIAVLKMDLEGAELMALTGASTVLARTNAILLESNDRDDRVFALIDKAGFEVKRLHGNNYLGQRKRTGE